jgi:hypothetical protein
LAACLFTKHPIQSKLLLRLKPPLSEIVLGHLSRTPAFSGSTGSS